MARKKVNKPEHTGVHGDTNKLFDELLGAVGNEDASLILRALRWQCILIEELSVGLSDIQEAIGKIDR